MDKKGISDIYNDVCEDLSQTRSGFIDWILDPKPGLQQGMICKTIVWYVKSDRWYLDEAHYDPIKEEDSTWYAKKYTGKLPCSNTSNIMKYFKLEKDERLISTNGKVRPVILLRNTKDDWWNPTIASRHENTWLCLPLFTYKPRHSQGYVLNDQRLNNPDAFYIPSSYGNKPGPDYESCARFQSLQMIKEEHLSPLKKMCQTSMPQMSRPFGLTKIGIEIVMYHFYSNLHIFTELEEPNTKYILFKEEVNRLLDAAMK